MEPLWWFWLQATRETSKWNTHAYFALVKQYTIPDVFYMTLVLQVLNRHLRSFWSEKYICMFMQYKLIYTICWKLIWGYLFVRKSVCITYMKIAYVMYTVLCDNFYLILMPLIDFIKISYDESLAFLINDQRVFQFQHPPVLRTFEHSQPENW